MRENLFHTTMQVNLMEGLHLKLGYPSSQQLLPGPWLHLLVKTNVTSLVQSLLREWQCQKVPLHVSGFHWKQIQTRLKFLLRKNDTLCTLIIIWTNFLATHNNKPLHITVNYNLHVKLQFFWGKKLYLYLIKHNAMKAGTLAINFITSPVKEFFFQNGNYFHFVTNQIFLWNQCMRQQIVFILPLYFNCSQSLISKFTLLIHFQCLIYHINSLINVASPL